MSTGCTFVQKCRSASGLQSSDSGSASGSAFGCGAAKAGPRGGERAKEPGRKVLPAAPLNVGGLQAMNAEDSGVALMFKTHPAPAERLATLDRMQAMLDKYAAQPQLADRFLQTIKR